MEVTIGVGRIGAHSGHRTQNKELFNVDSDLQYITLDDLTDRESVATLLGCWVDLNHGSKVVGVVDSVFTENGILKARATINDPLLETKLTEYKLDKRVLESSPRFICNLALDSHSRVCQSKRKYERISILLPGIAGRGGPDVKLEYSDVNMEELQAKIDALVALVQQVLAKEEKEDCDPDAYAKECYDKGMSEGMAYAHRESQLIKLGVESDSSTEQIARIRKALDANKLPTTGKTTEYCYAALEVLANQPKATPTTKFEYSAADAPAPRERKKTVTVKL